METKTLKIDSDLHEKLKTLAAGSKYSIQDIVESKLQELLEHKEDMIFQFEKDIEYNTVKDTYTVKLKSYSYHKLIDFLEIFLSNRNLNNVQEIKAVLEASEFLKYYSNDRSKKINTDNYIIKDDFYERFNLLLCVNYSKYDDTKFPFNVPSIPVLIDTKTLNCYRKISDEYIVRLKQECSIKSHSGFLENCMTYNMTIDNLIITRNKIIDKYENDNNNKNDNFLFIHMNVMNDLIKQSINDTDIEFDKMLIKYNIVYKWLNKNNESDSNKHIETKKTDKEIAKIFKQIPYSELSFEQYMEYFKSKDLVCPKYLGIYDTYTYSKNINTTLLRERFQNLDNIQIYNTRYDDFSIRNAGVHELRNNIINFFVMIQNSSSMLYTNVKHDKKVYEYLDILTYMLKEVDDIYINGEKNRINVLKEITDWFKNITIKYKPAIFTTTVVDIDSNGSLVDRIINCESYSDKFIEEFIKSLNLPSIATIEDIKDIENRERFDRFILDMFSVYNMLVNQALKGQNNNYMDRDWEAVKLTADLIGSINTRDLDKIQIFIESIKNKEVIFNIPVEFSGTVYNNVMDIIKYKCVIVKEAISDEETEEVNKITSLI